MDLRVVDRDDTIKLVYRNETNVFDPMETFFKHLKLNFLSAVCLTPKPRAR